MNSQLPTLLARQGIYTREGSVYAYELLYRNPGLANVNLGNGELGDKATSLVITQLFASMDIDTIIGDKLAYINFTHSHLIQKVPTLLPKERIVIEVLESVIVDKPLIDSLSSLREQGYCIALDDFIPSEKNSILIDLANIIKIDVLNLNKRQIAAQLRRLKHFKGKLLAEKIESHNQYKDCIELGFDYFQGFFLNKPRPLKGQQITENKAHLIRVLAELNNEDIPLERVEEFILHIPKLSYRLLRLANSAAAYNGRKIDSLIDALKRLGLNQVRNWLRLFLLANQNDLMSDLVERTLIRAKMCECLAKLSSEYVDPHQAFTMGIFSSLDAFLNEPMTSILSKIQLSEVLNDALLHQRGQLGKILKDTINYEEGNFNKLENSAYGTKNLINAYLESIEYARAIMRLTNQ
ncbi:EAL and HDOD domain-containing protein [Legionella saoudiensis]|uniref:EAL and HDOD domain-containing protein n=1 Tax=Legionella saoudiensis TaxID=1750561 RepID=UPI000730A3DD|nr:HDOD domain-containing protein [Legionella saoudiensis]